MSAGSPPDLVLDLTNGGLESEAVKSLTRDLGLPTLTTSMGGPGDIREWAGLSEQQSRYLVQVTMMMMMIMMMMMSRYLVQVRGPHDLYPRVMWDLAHSTNLSTAAILYDETFGKVTVLSQVVTLRKIHINSD